MVSQQEIRELESFIEKARKLKSGDKPVDYTLPRPRYGGTLAFVMIEYRRPIALFYSKHGNTGQVWYKDVMWSPKKLRRRVLKELGYFRGTGFWEWLALYRRRSINQWWEYEWADSG